MLKMCWDRYSENEWWKYVFFSHVIIKMYFEFYMLSKEILGRIQNNAFNKEPGIWGMFLKELLHSA